MKIKNGFVSNSSSSSFVVYGKMYEGDYIDSIGERLLPEAFCEDSDDYDDRYDCLFGEKLDYKFTWVEDPNTGDVYIGDYLSNIQDNETLKQFKERVENNMDLIFGEDDTEFELFDFVVDCNGSIDHG